MDNKITSKQQIVDKIKDAANILVTVSNNPTVDALSAALGLTLAIDKLEKHATAVFSGNVPPAITFLQPEKTFENTIDSLRDFIIALDKEKADHLRYKVEGDMVKIFITPYRTTITSDDLEFSQGDYNVELVLALGVSDQGHLDAALDAHGRILHDATVATITVGAETSDLGGIDWHDDTASSLSEMTSQLIDALKPDKATALLDQQIATALLTGVVAETDRFSNAKTTSQVMTIAAQLMAAGADQQLVATKLQEGHAVNNLTPPPSGASPATAIPAASEAPKDKTTLSVEHTNEPGETTSRLETLAPSPVGETLEELDRRVKAEHEAEAVDVAAEALKEQLGAGTPTAQATAPTSTTNEPTPAPIEVQPVNDSDLIGHAQTQTNSMGEPSFGGTLNATTEEAADEARAELADDRNKTTLNHKPYLGSAATASQSVSGAAQSEEAGKAVDPFMSPTPEGGEQALAGTGITIEPPADMAVEPLAQPGQSDLAALQQASTLNPVYAPDEIVTPNPTPSSLGLPLPPPLPDFSSLQTPDVNSAYALDPAEPLVAPPPASTPDRLGDILPPAAPIVPPVTPDVPPAAPNPGQFQIPGAGQQ